VSVTALLLAGLLAFAESAVGLGLLLPGETAIVALATTGSTATAPLVLAVAFGATAGDHVGYLVGRRWGTRLADTRLIHRVGVQRWERATDLLRRHGVAALLASRLLPVVRTVMPAVAGAAGLSYPRFATASVVGALAWASLWVGAGSTINALSQTVGTPVVIAVLAVVAATAALVTWCRRVSAVHTGAAAG
jgi:membrane protein DedA with SNARE-associated domain